MEGTSCPPFCTALTCPALRPWARTRRRSVEAAAGGGGERGQPRSPARAPRLTPQCARSRQSARTLSGDTVRTGVGTGPAAGTSPRCRGKGPGLPRVPVPAHGSSFSACPRRRWSCWPRGRGVSAGNRAAVQFPGKRVRNSPDESSAFYAVCPGVSRAILENFHQINLTRMSLDLMFW